MNQWFAKRATIFFWQLGCITPTDNLELPITLHVFGLSKEARAFGGTHTDKRLALYQRPFCTNGSRAKYI